MCHLLLNDFHCRHSPHSPEITVSLVSRVLDAALTTTMLNTHLSSMVKVYTGRKPWELCSWHLFSAWHLASDPGHKATVWKGWRCGHWKTHLLSRKATQCALRRSELLPTSQDGKKRQQLPLWKPSLWPQVSLPGRRMWASLNYWVKDIPLASPCPP